MTPPLFTEVPRDEQEWLNAARAVGLENKTLRTYDHLEPASKVTKPQFLLYRTIFVKRSSVQFNPSTFGLGTQFAYAVNLLQSSTDFQSYINAIKTRTFGGAGNFTPLREQQREVLECESGTGMILTQKDESPVNATFINMLQAIASISLATRDRWRHTKIELLADFGRNRSFSAITDGQLQDIQTGEIRAIAECKRDRRTANRVKIEMQEASQIVALIRHFSSTAPLHFLFSQDDDEFYFTVAESNASWLQYLNQGRANPRSFMKMHQFGPFSLRLAAEVENFAAIVLSLSL